MNYSTLHNLLTTEFSLDKECIELPEGQGEIVIQEFHADKKEETNGSYSKAMYEAFMGYNSLSYRNLHFRYPVFRTNNDKARNGAIVLLHGLNERSWDKYLTWAYRLAERTGKSVILFPISLHMNRSPEAWGDPRQMTRFVQARQKFMPDVKNLSVANVALSERLTYEPEQFFLSGYQSANDVLQLARSIKNGSNKLFNVGAAIDFFGYSIGAFLSEILLLANPDKIFEHSKCFLFCGGSAFSELNGTSKYILDDKAFERVLEFYKEELDDELKRKGTFAYLIKNTQLGCAFRNMISLKHFRKISKNVKNRIKGQISVIALKKDKVVPLEGVRKTLKNIKLNVLDFEFNYSHEYPFPLLNDEYKQKDVDNAFEEVFLMAGSELK